MVLFLLFGNWVLDCKATNNVQENNVFVQHKCTGGYCGHSTLLYQNSSTRRLTIEQQELATMVSEVCLKTIFI